MSTSMCALVAILIVLVTPVRAEQDQKDLEIDVYHSSHFDCYSCSYLDCGEPFNETSVNIVSCDGACYKLELEIMVTINRYETAVVRGCMDTCHTTLFGNNPDLCCSSHLCNSALSFLVQRGLLMRALLSALVALKVLTSH